MERKTDNYHITDYHIDTIMAMERRDKELSACLTKILLDIHNINRDNMSYVDRRRNTTMASNIRDFLRNSLNEELRLIQMRLSEGQHLPQTIDYSNIDFRSTVFKSIELLDTYAYWFALSPENSSSASKLSMQMQKYLIKIQSLESEKSL